MSRKAYIEDHREPINYLRDYFSSITVKVKEFKDQRSVQELLSQLHSLTQPSNFKVLQALHRLGGAGTWRILLRETGMPEETLSRSLRLLEQRGLVRRYSGFSIGRGRGLSVFTLAWAEEEASDLVDRALARHGEMRRGSELEGVVERIVEAVEMGGRKELRKKEVLNMIKKEVKSPLIIRSIIDPVISQLKKRGMVIWE